jgi:hypothetical protein
MTIAMQEEARKWEKTLVPAAPPSGQPYPRLVLRTPGFVEIKPHTLTGIKAGLKQLGKRLENATPKADTGVLATYLAVDSGGRPLPTGKAKYLRVYAVLVNRTPTPTLAQYRLPRLWHYLGMAPLPERIEHPSVDHPGAFGFAVEKVVQQQVMNVVSLQTPKKKWTPGGGSRPGPDMTYDELADFYRELAHELRDPRYADREVA